MPHLTAEALENDPDGLAILRVVLNSKKAREQRPNVADFLHARGRRRGKASAETAPVKPRVSRRKAAARS
jgi:hypothetical protein